MKGVQLREAVKKYDRLEVIHGINLDIQPSELCVFVGPSGCGKSTLLRMIAGLEETSSGTIHIGDREVTNIDAAERGIAMVFQTYALYPQMTVEENMSFGLRMTGHKKKDIKEKIEKVARTLQLEPYMKRKPKALSGGQRQRVAIGRALVRGPDVFLFDEPLSNLDAELRVDMRVEIARLHQELGTTMIYVTHDQVEAMTLADKIVVLRAGNIEQTGSPMELYDNPDNKFVAGFIGSPSMNFIKTTAQKGTVSNHILGHKDLTLPTTHSGDILIGVRPEHVSIDVKGDTLSIEIIEKLGGVAYIYVNTNNGERLVIESKDSEKISRGDRVGLQVDTTKLYFFDANSEQRLRVSTST